jgi:hypothetical protein
MRACSRTKLLWSRHDEGHKASYLSVEIPNIKVPDLPYQDFGYGLALAAKWLGSSKNNKASGKCPILFRTESWA